MAATATSDGLLLKVVGDKTTDILSNPALSASELILIGGAGGTITLNDEDDNEVMTAAIAANAIENLGPWRGTRGLKLAGVVPSNAAVKMVF